MTHETNTAGNLAVERTGLQPLGRSIAAFADQALRFSIVIVLGWIGAMKFTAYEAGAIQGLVASSPFTAWLYGVFDLQTTSNLIGSIEIATALALVLAPLHRSIADGRCHGDLRGNTEFPVQRARLGTKPGWISGTVGRPGAVPAERCCLAGRVDFTSWSGAPARPLEQGYARTGNRQCES
jgi:hypothetical protein